VHRDPDAETSSAEVFVDGIRSAKMIVRAFDGVGDVAETRETGGGRGRCRDALERLSGRFGARAGTGTGEEPV
jgi:hypothetical protein